jgi:hypothetical protein
MVQRLGGAILALSGVLMMCGCGGGGAASVSGSVTYNEQPIESGTITFTPVGGEQSFTAQISAGKYTAANAQAGQFTALVEAGGSAAASSREAYQQQGAAAQSSQKSANYIPADATGNGQTVEVSSGEQVINFEIKGPPRP